MGGLAVRHLLQCWLLLASAGVPSLFSAAVAGKYSSADDNESAERSSTAEVLSVSAHGINFVKVKDLLTKWLYKQIIQEPPPGFCKECRQYACKSVAECGYVYLYSLIQL